MQPRHILKRYIADHFSRNQKLVLILHYYEQLADHEIALVLDLEPAQVTTMREQLVDDLRAVLPDTAGSVLPSRAPAAVAAVG